MCMFVCMCDLNSRWWGGCDSHTGDKYLNCPSASTAAGKYFLWMGTEAICFISLGAPLTGIQQSEGEYRTQAGVCVWWFTEEEGRQLKRRSDLIISRFRQTAQQLTETCTLCVNRSQIDLRIRFPGRDASVDIDLEDTCFCLWGWETNMKERQWERKPCAYSGWNLCSIK